MDNGDSVDTDQEYAEIAMCLAGCTQAFSYSGAGCAGVA